VLDELLARACASIQYRLRLEILNQPAADGEMVALQEQILEDDAVKEVLSWQQPDGWLARDFHGRKSLESGIRLLREKGVDGTHPVIARALQVLAERDDRLARGIGIVGQILDELGFGGSQMIRAVVFAYAGREEVPLVREPIDKAITASLGQQAS
jgi:hypothetical protein